MQKQALSKATFIPPYLGEEIKSNAEKRCMTSCRNLT